jgi:hypothetical protein
MITVAPCLRASVQILWNGAEFAWLRQNGSTTSKNIENGGLQSRTCPKVGSATQLRSDSELNPVYSCWPLPAANDCRQVGLRDRSADLQQIVFLLPSRARQLQAHFYVTACRDSIRCVSGYSVVTLIHAKVSPLESQKRPQHHAGASYRRMILPRG